MKNIVDSSSSNELGSILQTKILEEDDEMDECDALGSIVQHIQTTSFDKFKAPQVDKLNNTIIIKKLSFIQNYSDVGCQGTIHMAH